MSSSPSKKKLFVRRKRQHRTNVKKQGEEDHSDSASNPDLDPEYKMQETHCQECSSTSKVAYRPLVNVNGSYLCDACYKTKFPATAMCDMTQNQNLIVSKFHERDIRKKQNLITKNTKEEDEIGKYKYKYTEEEECCSCLEKGVYRQCCKKYYCHLCYYNKTKACPGCGVPIHRSGVTIGRSKPKKIAVLASWGISCYIVLIILSILALLVAHNQTRPETVWKGICHGWFPSCERPVCIDLDTSATKDDTIKMPIQYNFCSINHSVNKVIGKTCIIDSQLYRESNGMLGYDLCIEKHRDKKVNAPSTLSDEKFIGGAYVFEDNFDYWKNSTNYDNQSVIMKSARWSHMINAKTSQICGFNSLVRSYEVEIPQSEEVNALKKSSALVFSGVQKRFAETIDLDVQFGGRVEFYIKFAPIVENELETECKNAFNGDIALSFSLDHGISWSIIKPYPVWKFRRDSFSFVNETIPLKAQSNHTRFRWEQPTFDSIRDFWALDDIRIYHRFHPNWRKGDWFEGRKSTRRSNDQQEQCCLDTEQCLHFPNQRNVEGCGSTASTESGPMYRMKIVDMFIVAAVMLSLLRKGCRNFQHWFSIQKSNNQRVVRTDETDTGIMVQNKQSSIKTLKEYNFDVSRSWQMVAFVILSLPFVLACILLCWHIYSSEYYYDKRSIELHVCILAVGLDFWTIRSLSMNVLHFWPCHVLPRIQVDKSYDDYVLWIGDVSIPILDISSVELFSERYYIALFVCAFVSGLPLATSSILIKALMLSYGSYIVILELLGCSLILRSVLGPKWFMEIYLSLTWIFTPSMKARDEMGRAMEKPSIQHVVTNFTILAIFLFLVLALSFQPLHRASALVKISIFTVMTLTGSICGSLLGMLRGLPVAPEVHLTTWPWPTGSTATEGYYSFVNERCIPPSLVWANTFAGGMNRFHLHVLQVKKQQEFRELLRGSNELEMVNSIYPTNIE